MDFRKDHIIQKQTIEISFDDLDTTVGLQNRIAEVFKERIQPRMTSLLDEQFGDQYFAAIDSIEIDCGTIDLKDWENEFVETVCRKLQQELLQVNKCRIHNNRVDDNSNAEVFLYFLEHGFMPWNNRVVSLGRLESLLVVNSSLISSLKILLRDRYNALKRLLNNFSRQFLSNLAATIVREDQHAKEMQVAISELKIASPVVDTIVITAFASVDKEEFKNRLSPGLKTSGIDDTDVSKLATTLFKDKEKTDPPKDNKKDKALAKTVYINNAGIILLHPFLNRLFERLALTEKDEWVSSRAQQQAVLVLQYLASGDNSIEEFNLPLNKILCGMAVEDPIDIAKAVKALSQDIKNECNILLQDVIHHWEALKNTSVEGLREAFLNRNGKLEKKDNGWLLQVEQKAIDVLLGRLPWGFGFIKLPWMIDPIFTEWA